MRKLKVLLALLAILALAGSLPAATFAVAPQREKLQMYVIEGSGAAFATATRGLELVDIQQTATGTRAEGVLTPHQAAKIRALGVSVKLLRNDKGQTVQQQARIQALNGFTVWRSWDEDGGIRDELHDIAH